MDERFNGIDGRFEHIEVRLDTIDERFDGVDRRFDELSGVLSKTFEGFEQRMTVRLDRIEHLLIRELTNRVERLEDSYRKLATAIGE